MRRYFRRTRSRAIVLFDKEGCGREASPAPELEDAVREGLRRSGWAGRAEAIVLDPELEVWAWSDSPEVAKCLGWTGARPRLREWLEQEGLWQTGALKPSDPKGAVRRVLHQTRMGSLSPALVRLARSVGLRRCTDRAFLRFCQILQRWFPAD